MSVPENILSKTRNQIDKDFDYELELNKRLLSDEIPTQQSDISHFIESYKLSTDAKRQNILWESNDGELWSMHIASNNLIRISQTNEPKEKKYFRSIQCLSENVGFLIDNNNHFYKIVHWDSNEHDSHHKIRELVTTDTACRDTYILLREAETGSEYVLDVRSASESNESAKLVNISTKINISSRSRYSDEHECLADISSDYNSVSLASLSEDRYQIYKNLVYRKWLSSQRVDHIIWLPWMEHAAATKSDHLLVAYRGGTLAIYDKNGVRRYDKTFEKKARILNLDITFDSKYLLVSTKTTNSNTLYVYQNNTNCLQHKYSLDNVDIKDFSDKYLVVEEFVEHVIHVYNIGNGTKVGLLTTQLKTELCKMVVSDGGHLLMFKSDGLHTSNLDLFNRKRKVLCPESLAKHADAVLTASYSENELKILINKESEELIPSSIEGYLQLNEPQGDKIESIILDSKERYLIIRYGRKFPKVAVINKSDRSWGIERQKTLKPRADDDERVTGISLSQDGRYIAVGTHLGNVEIWEYVPSEPSLVKRIHTFGQTHNHPVVSLGISSGSTNIVCSVDKAGELAVRPINSPIYKNVIRKKSERAHPFSLVAISSQGDYLAVSIGNSQSYGSPCLFFWHVDKLLKCSQHLHSSVSDRLSRGYVQSLWFMGSSQRIATFSQNLEDKHEIHCWDLCKKNMVFKKTLPQNSAPIYGPATNRATYFDSVEKAYCSLKIFENMDDSIHHRGLVLNNSFTNSKVKILQEKKEWKIFISYARCSDDRQNLKETKKFKANRDYVEQLASHLEKNNNGSTRLTVWYDRKILAGEDYEKDIADNINASTVFIVCLSKRFFESKYINEVELPLIKKKSEDHGNIIFPIVFSDCNWQESFFGRYQGPDNNGEPLLNDKYPPNEAMIDNFLAVYAKELTERLTSETKKYRSMRRKIVCLGEKVP